jgi:hypothetical protein
MPHMPITKITPTICNRLRFITCASSNEVAQSIPYKKLDTIFILFDYLNLKAK